jgi:DNA (cytosine-5)-methyltransferase 1
MALKPAIQCSYRKISQHRGKDRFWIDNQKIGIAGFERGASYTVHLDKTANSFRLELDPEGECTVYSKTNSKTGKTVPVIDYKGDAIAYIGKLTNRIRVDIRYGEIICTIHHFDEKQKKREEAFIKNASQGKVTKGSACAGIGIAAAALADGLSDVGVKSTLSWIIDRETKYLQVAIDNNYAVSKDTLVIAGSLEEVEADLIPQTDLVQFSLPCTIHSKAGKAKNKNKVAEQHATDATALLGLMKIIDKANAAIYVSENVVEAMNSASYEMLKSMFMLLGYRIYEFILDDEQAGTIEKRTRYWFVAVSLGLPEIDVTSLETFAKQFNSIADVVEPNTVTDSLWRKHDYLVEKEARDIEAGKNFRRSLYTYSAKKINAIGRFYFKRRSTEPFLVNEEGLERLLTPIEHCRVKGIPEVLVAGVSDMIAHEGLGQSILFNHARGIGRLLGRELFLVSTNITTIFDRALNSSQPDLFRECA